VRALPLSLPAGAGSVRALLLRPPASRWLLVLAHGAGAGMEHPFMSAVAGALARQRIATLRYQFPYMEAGRKRPDRPAALIATVQAAVATARRRGRGLILLAGGKSMGGRMTSQAAAAAPLPGVAGLVFLGFPLHPAGKPSVARGQHLDRVSAPMLFLQGSRDRLAALDRLRPVCRRLGKQATLHVVAGADHAFHVLRRSGRSDTDVVAELAAGVAGWAARLGDGTG
jgi:predicted alpha/beta-hydrolase family hydrolase